MEKKTFKRNVLREFRLFFGRKNLSKFILGTPSSTRPLKSALNSKSTEYFSKVDDIRNVSPQKGLGKIIWYTILAELSLFSCVCVCESIVQKRLLGLEIKAFEIFFSEDVT